MSPLSNEQKQLLFDYCIGLTTEEQTAEAQALISTNSEAAEIYSSIKAALEPLDSVEPQVCPDGLVERTFALVKGQVDSSIYQLEQLLAVEQAKKSPVKIGFWRNLMEVAAVAASIMLIVGVLVPVMDYAHQRNMQNVCGLQMGSFFDGLNSYIADHDGYQPSVSTATGEPWWKIGYQGRENHSNTRRVFLLVRYGYVEPKIFICPGNKNGRNYQIEPSQITNYRDFPNRQSVTYSFQISCVRDGRGKLQCRRVIMSDWNPIFEELPNYNSTLSVRLNKKLLTVNSSNHNLRGQNVLFGDGRVEFLKSRFIKVSQDDIFTLQDTDVYQGIEVPSCETDFFLAP
ncbi:MAG: hypothetical protein JW715_00450 [Sedimentisphaerales bacterium]|nr:hypothetical protein [Sedimentisphaerales bacterium]